MADSDEEYDRKKRDKFRRERNDYSSERRKSDHEKRTTWRDEYYEARRRSRDGEGDRDRRGYMNSPPHRDWSPPGAKRLRRGGGGGWEGMMGVMGHYGMMDHRGPWMMGTDMPSHGGHMGTRPIPGDLMMGYPPIPSDSRQRGATLLTFKQFLAQQDDNIDDTEAVRLYQEYKADYKKKQLHQFFNDHKEEEWFLSKYHPKYITKNQKESQENLSTRLSVFNNLYSANRIQPVSLTQDQSDDIIRLMDTAVILMEGGTEFDLKVLDGVDSKESEREVINQETNKENELNEDTDKEEEKAVTEAVQGNSEEIVEDIQNPPVQTLDTAESSTMDEDVEEDRRGVKRVREEEEDEFVTSPKRKEEEPPAEDEFVPHQEDTETEPQPETGQAETDTTQPITDVQTETDTLQTETDTDTLQVETDTLQTETDTDALQVETDTLQTESDTLQVETDTLQAETDTLQAETNTLQTETNVQAKTDTETQTTTDTAVQKPPVPDKPRPFHLTKAVYMRHITPQVSVADILEVCRTIPGFLRISLAEPQPERGYERRGWVTYSNDTNIKDVCARLSTQKIKNCQLSCQINRDLSRRAKSAAGVTWARAAVEFDVQLLMKLVNFLDKKNCLWNYGSDNTETSSDQANPVVSLSETSLLTHHSSAATASTTNGTATASQEEGEEEEGVIVDPGTAILKPDSPLIKAMDLLIWYVRLVHSLDYYNCTVFADEDHMPHRCGIITTRPAPPNVVTNEEVSEYVKSMESKLESMMKEKCELDAEEMEKLGKRDHESEVEKFIEVNTQKLGENKYLCPLSGKKFRGPEFVRKHILNKHSEALEEVRSETDFFNNYLKDPQRPVPLETAAVLPIGGDDDKGSSRNLGPSPSGGRGWSTDGSRRGRGHSFRGRGERRGRRFMKQYNDLDMPDDMY